MFGWSWFDRNPKKLTLLTDNRHYPTLSYEPADKPLSKPHCYSANNLNIWLCTLSTNFVVSKIWKELCCILLWERGFKPPYVSEPIYTLPPYTVYKSTHPCMKVHKVHPTLTYKYTNLYLTTPLPIMLLNSLTNCR